MPRPKKAEGALTGVAAKFSLEEIAAIEWLQGHIRERSGADVSFSAALRVAARRGVAEFKAQAKKEKGRC